MRSTVTINDALYEKSELLVFDPSGATYPVALPKTALAVVNDLFGVDYCCPGAIRFWRAQ